MLTSHRLDQWLMGQPSCLRIERDVLAEDPVKIEFANTPSDNNGSRGRGHAGQIQDLISTGKAWILARRPSRDLALSWPCDPFARDDE